MTRNDMKKGSAAVLVVVLVVAVLAFAGMFAYKNGLFGNLGSGYSQPATNTSVEQGIEDRSDLIKNVSGSDKISAIESDLSGTDINSLDKDVLGVKTEAEGL